MNEIKGGSLKFALIALGANLPGPAGSPANAIEAALRAFPALGLDLRSHSRLYRSPAWPDPVDPAYVNAVAQIDTVLSPADLLERLHGLEASFGRVRASRNAPRPLDLDIVDYDGRVSLPEECPILPHPRLADRAFVLRPMAEIAPEWRHPVTGISIAALIAALPPDARAEPL